jgi:hypothetical protein
VQREQVKDLSRVLAHILADCVQSGMRLMVATITPPDRTLSEDGTSDLVARHHVGHSNMRLVMRVAVANQSTQGEVQKT